VPDSTVPEPEEQPIKKKKPKMINLFALYRYTTWYERIILFIGIIAAVLSGFL
jgi:hypothetical protein